MSGLYEAGFVARLGRGVESLLPRWGLSAATRVSLLTVSENATFRADDPDTARTIVVRVHRPGYHTPAEIVSELAWIRALRESAVVTTPAPQPMGDGELLASFEDGDETRHVVAFEFFDGHEPSPDERLAEGFRTLGAISARLHAHARGWSLPDGFERKTWNLETILGDAPHWGRWQDAPGLDAGERTVLERAVDVLAERIGAYGSSGARFGLVHADLRLANLLVAGERLGVIDFDDCGFGWFLYDFAASTSFIEEEPMMGRLLAAWCAGYRTVGELGPEGEAMVPLFVMLRRLQLTAWLATHAETPTAAEFGAGYPAGTVRLARRLLDTGTPLSA